jgi:hypothetical protein
LIPVRTEDLADEDRVDALRKFDEMELRDTDFDEYFSKIISILKREYQRRNR